MMKSIGYLCMSGHSCRIELFGSTSGTGPKVEALTQSRKRHGPFDHQRPQIGKTSANDGSTEMNIGPHDSVAK